MIYKPTEDYELINKYKNYKYAIWFHDTQGYRCGYVQVPENHPLYKKSYMDLDIQSVSLTFSGHIKQLDGWFIGFDHHHIWDGIDEDGICKIHGNDPNINDILEYARQMGGNSEYHSMFATMEDVEEECHRLIDELVKIGGKSHDN